MAKFLKSIYRLQSAFNISSSRYTRTIEFGLIPTTEQIEKLDKWFKQVTPVKKGIYEQLYLKFKDSPEKFLNQKKVNYQTLFKGSQLLSSLKNGKDIVTDVPIGEGLRTEVTSTINSYLTNHRKAFVAIQDELKSITDDLKSNASILSAVPQDDSMYDVIKNINSEIEEKLLDLTRTTYDNVIKSFDDILSFVQRLNYFNSLVASYNFHLNLVKQAYLLDGPKFLQKTQRLPEFPNSSNIETKETFEDLSSKLELFTNTDYDTEEVYQRLEEMFKKQNKRELWLKERLGKVVNKRSFTKRLLHWFLKNTSNSKEELVKGYFQRLDLKIEKLNRQFLKNHDLPAFRQMIYLKAYKARLIHPESRERINEITSTLAMLLLKGIAETEEFILPGFSWESKPNKNTALGFKNDFFYLFFSNTALDFDIGEGEIEFIKTTGGGRKKDSKQKGFERVMGGFNESRFGLALPLHFGKSYARRFITNKNWGLWLKHPGIELNNGKIKRVRISPNDEWHYFFDLTVSSNRPFQKDFEKQILLKAESVIGIDRGEKYPIAYVVKDIRNRNIIDEGLLGKEFIELLEKVDSEIKKYQQVGNRVPSRLKKKKSHLKETAVTSLISFLLEKAAENKAVFIIENLDRKFPGNERSLIPKKTYVAVEDSLISVLEFAGLLERSVSKHSKRDHYGTLFKVNKAYTSLTCPKCGFIWKKEEKEKLFTTLKNNRISIDYKNGIFSINGEKYKLAEKYIAYNSKTRSNEEKTLKDLQESEGKKEMFKNLFLGLLGPRISQESFICPKVSCGFTKNADLVGANNIADKGIEIIQKILLNK